MRRTLSYLIAIISIIAPLTSLAATEPKTKVVVVPLLGDSATWKGPWEANLLYRRSDIVAFNGSSYIALKRHTSDLSNLPPEASIWDLVAASGANGLNGVQGPAGATGVKGDVGDTGLAGAAGSAGAKGDSGDTGLTGLAGPVGVKGDTGLSGSMGLPGLAGAKGDKGDPGATGPAGGNITYTATAPIAINSTTNTISFSASALPVKDNMQPSLGLNYVIALQGIYPSRNFGSNDFLASVELFAGNFAPRGWALCEGQLLPIAQYTALFSLLGTTYGGDGRTSFGLPDLRGRVVIGTGTGPGLTPRSLGTKVGGETIRY